MMPSKAMVSSLWMALFSSCFLLHISATPAPLLVATGTTYLGTGYDMLHGNPEGQGVFEGGPDPGLKATRQILAITRTERDACPQEATCALIDISLNTTDLIDDMDKFSKHVQRGWGFAHESGVTSPGEVFVMAGKDEMRTEIKKLLEEDQDVLVSRQTWKYTAEATYKYNAFRKLDDEFQAQLCKLRIPYDENKAAFQNFLTTWGTHVIVHTQIGEKDVDQRVYKKTDYVSFLLNTFPAVAQASGTTAEETSYSVHSKSKELSDQVHDIAEGLLKYTKPARINTKQFGSPTAPVPLNVEIVDLSYFVSRWYVDLSSYFCQGSHDESSLNQLKKALQEAIVAYIGSSEKTTSYVEDVVRTVPAKDINVILWPAGSFTLLKTKNDCPTGWEEGSRSHDLNDSGNYTSWSEMLKDHMDGDFGQDFVFKFCSNMGSPTKSTSKFEAGSYCFFKKGFCPTGMNLAQIFVNDEDSGNSNRLEGVFPDGIYGKDTIYNTCCRMDGDPTHAISLPNAEPFFLLPVKQGVCQQVRNMISVLEWIQLDEDEGHRSETVESRPWTEVDDEGNIKIYLCYYMQATPE